MRRFPQTILELYSELLDRGYAEDDLKEIRRAYELQCRLFCSRFTGSGKTHLAHGVGTAGILAAVGAPLHVLKAGFVHNAYGLADFGDGRARIATARRRAELRRAIGERSEACVHAFREIAWHKDLGTIVERFDELDSLTRDVLLLRLADWLEHHLDAGMLYRHSSDTEFMLRTSLAIRAQVAELAERLGYPQFVGYFEDAYAELETRHVPEVMRQGAAGSLIVPRSYSLRLKVACINKLEDFNFRLRRPLGKIASRLRAISGAGG